MKILRASEQKVERVAISSAFNDFCFDDQCFQNRRLWAKSQAILKGCPSSFSSE